MILKKSYSFKLLCLISLLLLIMTAMVVGCGSQDETAPPADEQDTTEENDNEEGEAEEEAEDEDESFKETYTIDYTETIGDLEVKINSLTLGKNQLNHDGEEFDYVSINLDVTNNRSEGEVYDPWILFSYAVLSTGEQTDTCGSNFDTDYDFLHDIEPGDTTSGNLYWYVEESDVGNIDWVRFESFQIKDGEYEFGDSDGEIYFDITLDNFK